MAFSTRSSVGFASHRSARKGTHHTWSGTAFVIEALVLLAFMVASLAILLTLFSDAHLRAEDTLKLEAAVAVAGDEAEAFGANPFAVPAEQEVTYQDQTCTVRLTPDAMVYAGGVLYNATISVSFDNEELYTVQTARYVRSGTSTTRLLSQGETDSACSILFAQLVADGRMDAQGNVLVADVTGDASADTTGAPTTPTAPAAPTTPATQAGGVA